MIPILMSFRGTKKDKEEIKASKEPYDELKSQLKKGNITHEQYVDGVAKLDRERAAGEKNNALWIELAAVGAAGLVAAVGVSKLL